MGRNARKCTLRYVCLAKIQISLCIRTVWPEFSMADNEDFDQTVRMCNLIWVVVWGTYQTVRSLTLRLKRILRNADRKLVVIGKFGKLNNTQWM